MSGTAARIEAPVFSRESIEDFLAFLAGKGRRGGTLEKYRRDLQALYDFLPEEKLLTVQTLPQWQAAMREQGYALRTLNSRLSAANSYLEYLGRRDLQMSTLEKPEGPQPELTRQEYLRLLSAAKALGKECTYLLVKLLGTTGLALHQLPEVTVEAAWNGSVGELKISGGLREELLSYAAKNDIVVGPLFITRAGRPIARTNVADRIRSLSSDARVAPEKANPRCLQRLCRETRGSIEREIARLVEQSYDHLLETEQLTIGWEEN